MLQQHRLRRLVAAGAATLIAATGVGLGTVPAFAEDAAPAEVSALDEASAAAAPEAFASQPRLKGKWVMPTGSIYSGILDGPDGMARRIAGTATEVRGKTATLTYPGVGDYGPIKTESGRCLGLAPGDTLVQIQPCHGGPLQTWHIDADGLLTAPNARGLQAYGLYDQKMYYANGVPTSSRLLMSELQPEVVQRDFSAWIDSRDENARSVLVLGYGTPGAIVTINGGQPTYVTHKAGWGINVTGLKLGVNTLNLEHRVNGVVTGSTTLTVQFGPDQLEANVSFPANVSERAIVSGTAEPGAEVSVWQGNTLVATASADRATGKYSTELPSPNKGGVQEYSLTQSVNNQDVPGAVSVRADYGSAVSIESPVNEMIHNGGELRFQGRGVPGGKVSLRENGRPGVLGTATVASNGIWTVTVADVAKKNLKFTAEQTGRGANVTTASVEINPGVTGETLQVLTPGEGQKLQPGTVTFTGTANAGATVELRSNLTGSLLGSGVANANGAWTASVNRQLGAGNYTILVKNGAREVARSFVIEAPAPQLKLDVVNPAQGSKLQPGTVTFTGTANAGAKIELRSNVSGALLGSGIATANGTWAVDVNRQLGAGEYTIVVKNGTLEVARSFSVVQKPVTAPLTVTSPANGATLKPGTVTFTGTATPGAAIELRSKTTGAMLGAGTATGNGSWSVQVNRQLGADTYNFQVKSGSQSVDRQFTVAETPSVTEFLQVTLPATNGTVQAGKVMFAGTANPGAVIELRSNVSGIVLGTGTTNQAGNWVAVTDRDLAKGTYTVIVRNGSLEESRTFFVDDVAVVGHLTVVTPAQGETVNPGPVTFTGLAEPHAKVVLRSNVSGLELGSGTANAAGSWSATTNVQLGVGSYTILVQSENNEIARSFQIR